MRIWRIAKLSDSGTLSGVGGIYVSGRWHHCGHRIIYASCAPSLAALEVLVHVDPAIAPVDLNLIQIDVPDDVVMEACDASSLTSNWRQFYPFPKELQDFGTAWLEEVRTAVLAVPSVVMPIEKNYLINPEHRDMPRIRVVDEHPFSFDPRLLKP